MYHILLLVNVCTQGRYEEADPMYVRAIKLGEENLGQDHPDVARGLADRAGLLRRQVRVDVCPRIFLPEHGLVKVRGETDHCFPGCTL